jgi:hypothetical protein
MRRGLVHIATLVTMLASAGAAAGAPTEADRRLVILESPTNQLSKSAQEHLRSAIGDVLVRHGVALVSSSPLPEKLSRCELPACLPQIAAASGAGLVLRLEASYVKESFKLAVELWNADEGKLLGRDARDCPICDEQDLWGSAALLVQGILERPAREAKPAPTEPPPLAPTAPPSAPVVASPATSGGGHALGYAGLGLTLAGAAVLGTGIYYLAVDGKSACDRCDDVRDTARYGRPLAIGGGVGMAAGVALIIGHFWPSAPAVAVGPSGITVAGRFQ